MSFRSTLNWFMHTLISLGRLSISFAFLMEMNYHFLLGKEEIAHIPSDGIVMQKFAVGQIWCFYSSIDASALFCFLFKCHILLCAVPSFKIHYMGYKLIFFFSPLIFLQV